MDESPPKRVTRARTAKTVDEKGTLGGTTATKRATSRTAAAKPSKTTGTKARAPATQRKPISQSKPAGRTTRSDKQGLENIEDTHTTADGEDTGDNETSSTRGGRKKVTSKETATTTSIDPPKPRGRPTRAAEATKSTSSRAKKGPESKGEEIVPATFEGAALQGPKRSTRTRTAGAPTKASTTKATSKASTTKKVTFQDEADKENIPLETKEKQKPARSTAGLRAKPVRKPAAPRVNTRTRKAVKDAPKDEETLQSEHPEPLPLSPKKIGQVAKASSVSSEDELISDKAVFQSPQKSPPKNVGNAASEEYRVSSSLQEPQVPKSPMKIAPISIDMSPARRPPSSPRREGLSASPKRIGLTFSPTKSALQATLNKTPMKSSLLQESPRKGKLSSAMKPILQSSLSPLKKSNFQSPARRPPVSPFKAVSPSKASPEKTASIAGDPYVDTNATIEEAVSSPLKAARSPERPLPVYNITPAVQKCTSVVDINSTITQTSAKPHGEYLINASEGGASPTASVTADPNEGGSESPQVEARGLGLSVEDHAWRRISMESASTDELASPDKKYAPTPLKRTGHVAQGFGTPATEARADVEENNENLVSFTPLVGKLHGWAASSPVKEGSIKPSRSTRGVFSFGKRLDSPVYEQEESTIIVASPAKPSFFDDEMAVFEQEQEEGTDVETVPQQEIEDGEVGAEERIELPAVSALVSQESESSEEYGDENSAPTVAEALREEQDAQDPTLTCTPAKVFTPIKVLSKRPQVVHTVSKVPLRPSAEESPLKLPRQRSRSFGGPLAVVSEKPGQATKASEEIPKETETEHQPATPKLAAALSPQTPISGMKLDTETPGRTVRKGANPEVLKGATVYVDVHTSEGADASGIFVDLLTQMGARCVKQWSWNPRASYSDSHRTSASMADDSPSSSPSLGKVGITHVVYKDGGKRTLEKVRLSKDVVLCVGVGWVLE